MSSTAGFAVSARRPALSLVVAAGLFGLVLSGCDSEEGPAASPTAEQALSTVTASEEPTEDAVETASAEPTEPPEDEGEMTKGGAEAAVQHYVDVLAAVHLGDAEVPELRGLATDGCKTCAAMADVAEAERFGHEYMRIRSSAAQIIDTRARVKVEVEQVSDGELVDTVFSLEWREDLWLIDKIQLDGEASQR